MARRDDRVVKEKQPKDLVTDADLASQSAIREILISAFSDYAFVGEEEGEDKPPQAVRDGDIDAPPCWVVDPLDGTVNMSIVCSRSRYPSGFIMVVRLDSA